MGIWPFLRIRGTCPPYDRGDAESARTWNPALPNHVSALRSIFGWTGTAWSGGGGTGAPNRQCDCWTGGMPAQFCLYGIERDPDLDCGGCMQRRLFWGEAGTAAYLCGSGTGCGLWDQLWRGQPALQPGGIGIGAGPIGRLPADGAGIPGALPAGCGADCTALGDRRKSGGTRCAALRPAGGCGAGTACGILPA